MRSGYFLLCLHFRLLIDVADDLTCEDALVDNIPMTEFVISHHPANHAIFMAVPCNSPFSITSQDNIALVYLFTVLILEASILHEFVVSSPGATTRPSAYHA